MREDPEHLPPTGVPAISMGLAAEEQRDHQVELPRRFRPSLTPEIPRRAVKQPPQPEITLISSESEESAIPSPRNSSDDSDVDMPIPDLDDSGVVQAVSGNGFQIVDQVPAETPTWTAPQFDFHAHGIRNQQVEAHEWMTEAEKRMCKSKNLPVVPWDHSGELMADRGEPRIRAVEMRRYDKCMVSPAPDNYIIVAAVLVVWSDRLIYRLKAAAKEDLPIGQSAIALGGLFRALPINCQVGILLDSSDVDEAFKYCRTTELEHTDPLQFIRSPKRNEMYTAMRRNGIRGVSRRIGHRFASDEDDCDMGSRGDNATLGT
jgi:hypothetical protein